MLILCSRQGKNSKKLIEERIIYYAEQGKEDGRGN